MDKHPILCACRDPGGMNAMVPVHRALQAAGRSSILIASGKSVELLGATGREAFRFYPSARDVLADIPEPAAVVVTFCEGRGGVGHGLVPLVRGRCPTIAHLDFWSAPFRAGNAWADPEHHPDYVAVSDRYGAQTARVGWRGTDDRIVELGFPALDAVAALDRTAVAHATRERLGISGDAFVVLCAGQDDGSAAMLNVLAGVLRSLPVGRPTILITREHPRMRSEWLEETVRWDAALKTLPSPLRVVNGSGFPDPVNLLCASDVVVSWCSTMLVTAAALRRFPIAWQPPTDFERYRAVAGGAVDEFPLVEMGCCGKATTEEALLALCMRACVGDTAFTSAQERELRLDGKSAERVAAFICGQVDAFHPSGR